MYADAQTPTTVPQNQSLKPTVMEKAIEDELVQYSIMTGQRRPLPTSTETLGQSIYVRN